jgi:Carboxypeptidase regulatory-like domain
MLMQKVEMRARRPRWLGEIAFQIATLLLAAGPVFARGQRPGQDLQLTISPESPAVVEPLPIRLALNFHNSGTQTLWLYKPVRDAEAMSQSSLGPSPGGSTLIVHLQPESAPAGASSSPAAGTLLRTAGMPRPRLIPIPPGGSYQENVSIHIAPSGSTWGAYQISVAYSASYSNGADIDRNLGIDVWQGSVSSNPVSIQLQPPSATNEGSISGTVLSREMQPDWGILVSLSDSNEHLVEQTLTGNDGGFSFSQLPYGRYWVTVRTPGANFNTGFFEHADVSPSDPAANLRLIMLSPEDSDDAKQILHKPVLFRIKDDTGNPVGGAELAILWSNGPIMETLKTETNDGGLAEINLIPGSNYVTIRKRGCPKQDEMANVAAGPGMDGFVMTFHCAGK